MVCFIYFDISGGKNPRRVSSYNSGTCCPRAHVSGALLSGVLAKTAPEQLRHTQTLHGLPHQLPFTTQRERRIYCRTGTTFMRDNCYQSLINAYLGFLVGVYCFLSFCHVCESPRYITLAIDLRGVGGQSPPIAFKYSYYF
jgi:predicted alpha/beta hydrolase